MIKKNYMSVDWILRVGDGKNFLESSKFKIWSLNSNTPYGKYFVKNVKQGDRLWFIKSKSKGKIIGVATYNSYNSRILGPLIRVTLTNEELGWTREGLDYTANTEIHYINLYNTNDCDLSLDIKGPLTIRKNIEFDLETEYNNIVKYSKIKTLI